MMRTARLVALSLSLVAVAGGVAWFGQRPLGHPAQNRHTELPVPVRPPDPGLAEQSVTGAEEARGRYDTRVQQLEAQVQQLQQALHRQHRVSEQHQADLRRMTHDLAAHMARHSAGAQGEEETLEASPDAEDEQQQERMAFLATAFASQPGATEGSPDASEQMIQLFDAELFNGSRLVAAQCAATLCQVEVDHDDSAAHEDFAGQFLWRLGWSTHAHMQTLSHPDGSVTSLMYLARDGQHLPERDPSRDLR